MRAMVVCVWMAAVSVVFGGQPAPPNPYRGTQTREEVFEFAEEPSVKREGAKWVIAFASKGRCDATVAILDKQGKVVRHLASGVLGPNAPRPFQQDSLEQRIEWDGLTDTFEKPPEGCRVRVSLGLKTKYELSMAFDPYDLPQRGKNAKEDPTYVGSDAQGNVYVGVVNRGACQGYVFDRQGKYLRTFCPIPAADVETSGLELATTKWGEKTIVAGWFGPFAEEEALLAVAERAGVKDFKKGPPPSNLPPGKDQGADTIFGKFTHATADPVEEKLYAGMSTVLRYDGTTGELDESWFPDRDFDCISEFHFAPDGMLYVRCSNHCYGKYLFRVDRQGKIVPFNQEYLYDVPTEGWWVHRPRAFMSGPLGAVFTGVKGHCNTHQRGLYVAPSGLIVTGVREVDVEWAKEHGMVPKDYHGKDGEVLGNWIIVFNTDGKLVSANAIGTTHNGHGVTMDRDGNLYAVIGNCVPPDQDTFYGIEDKELSYRVFGGYGSIVKFRGQGGNFPLGERIAGEEAPPDAVKVKWGRYRPNEPGYITGAEWVFGGVSGQALDCTCNHVRHDMDLWARSWVPANPLYSVIVLDANANPIARIGRYGNVDDTERDLREGRDGIRLCWPRAAAASDNALYVVDTGNRRILKAAISYAAEQTVALP